MSTAPWDYLIVTASNPAQARAYEMQLALRRELGLLAGAGEVLVVPDPGGRRVGSGGSTVYCLMEVLRRCDALVMADEGEASEGERGGVGEGVTRGQGDRGTKRQGDKASTWEAALRGLRILIIHAGGDSKRLPAYGPCGKILVPVPGESDRAVPMTLFDRQLPLYGRLPAPGDLGRPEQPHVGQIVITSGDVLLRFNPADVRFALAGVTALACYASPERAMHHGVLCCGAGHEVRLFLQKPTPEEQHALGAVDAYGQALLDVGVMSFDAATAARLLDLFGLARDAAGRPVLAGELADAIHTEGIDFYREICCGLGTEATFEHYLHATRRAGSRLDERVLRRIYDGLRGIPFSYRLLPHCEFLHFGTTRQIITSGYALVQQDLGGVPVSAGLSIGNELSAEGQLVGMSAWVEACRVRAWLELAGENVVTGVDIDAPLALPPGACLDVTPGRDRAGREVWFVRPYGAADTFKDTIAEGATFCGRPVLEWLNAAGARPEDVWPDAAEPAGLTVWDARLFPAMTAPGDYQQWLWMYEPETAADEARRQWLAADRYSMADMAGLVDLEAFFDRRADIRAENLARSPHRLFRPESEFSARELAWLLDRSGNQRLDWMAALLREVRWHAEELEAKVETGGLVLARLLHTLGTAVGQVEAWRGRSLAEAWPGLADRLSPSERDWLDRAGLGFAPERAIAGWCEQAQSAAFEAVSRVILGSNGRVVSTSAASAGDASIGVAPASRRCDSESVAPASRRCDLSTSESAPLARESDDARRRPRSRLRPDEIVWGRAPARLDLAGGWTDTPPFSLEHGGSVVNVAVNLNGLPPIQAYARVIGEPVIRISSIDLGARLEIRELSDLLDYRHAHGEFALVKAALALSGFDPDSGFWPAGTTLADMLAGFGGGLEITTLAAIPKGSGLGTSSIMGAVILSVVRRVMGETLAPRELFHGVLQLEQALTTGGGWQDQIGGATGGAKIVSTAPGLVPDPRIHYLPSDVIDPRLNTGRTLLYYTGVTRLAKDILGNVVGRYLDRDRLTLATLRRIGALAPRMADAVSGKQFDTFGRLVGEAWALNKRLDPDSTNPDIDRLITRIAPHAYGAKLPGAGGGGFLFIVCRSEDDARRVREMLDADPPNPRARFFDFQISHEGLVVTVC